MIKELLTKLNMKGALEVLESIDQIKERNEFLIALLKSEIEYKELRANTRRLVQAKFPTEKEWRDLDPTLNPSIEFSKIEKLNNGLFIQKKENLCLMGQQGTGKTQGPSDIRALIYAKKSFFGHF